MKGLWGLAWRNVRRRAFRGRLLGSFVALTAGLLFASYFFLHSLTVVASGTRSAPGYRPGRGAQEIGTGAPLR